MIFDLHAAARGPSERVGSGDETTREQSSLVPRPHPLTRRNGLVNQVEFLGLVGALATV